ncbi:MAG: TonB-dependent receptor [Bacteroidales bacterium]|nr:TonB-dependent receptor [Bacteroidales bacterium]
MYLNRSLRTYRSFVCLLLLISNGLEMKAIAVQDQGTDGRQTALPTDTLNGTSMQEVAVAGVYTPGAVTSTKPVQKMQRAEMERLGLTTLADAVKLFVGAEVHDYGGIGGMKTVSVRSLGAHHTAVSYDGLTLSNTQAGQIDIGRYQLDGVAEVSMAVGAPDNLLQTARHYASGGVVSVVSECPRFERNQKSEWRARLRGGSYGLLAPSLRYACHMNSGMMLWADAMMMRADGCYPFTLKNAGTTSREKRTNTDVLSWQGELNIHHTFRDSSTLKLKGSYYDSERGLPGAVILYNPFSDDRLWEREGFAQALYNKQFNAHWALRSGAKYTHTRSHFEGSNPVYPDGVQTDHSRQDEAYVTATVKWTPHCGLTFALAEDVSVNLLHSNIYINTDLDVPNPCRTTSLTALSGRYQTGRLQADASLVGTWAVEHVEAGDEPPVRHHLSPTVGLSYRLLADRSLFVRALLKHTFRMPSFNDTYYRRMGNPNLRPERANEYNIGVTWNGRPFAWMRYLSLTVDGYYNHVHDKIVAFPSAYVWRMANFGKVGIYGFDVTLATDIPLGRNFSMALTASYTGQDARDADKRSATYDKLLPYTPRSHGSASAIVHSPWVDLGYSVHSSSERYSSAQNKGSERLDAYAEHTLTASRALELKRCCVDLGLAVHNFTNAHYEIIQYYPMPGRSVQGTAQITF